MKKTLVAAAAAALIAAPLAAQAQGALPGFYVGIHGGLNYIHDIDVPVGTNEKLGFAVGGAIGYDFVGPRIEVEGTYRSNKVNASGLGSLGHLNSVAVIASVLYDFMPTSSWTPYIGVGAGAVFVEGSTELGVQPRIGVGFMLADNLRLNFDYRFLWTTTPKNNGTKFDYYNHTGMVGLTLKFPEAPAAPPAPTPMPTESFMVFFDFDKSNITAQAANTIKQAADAYKAKGYARIASTGHADRSGSDAYNMALSLRRANAVKDQLVRNGVPAANISVVGRGESMPLVQTADGVREPQNRRVEIVLSK